MNVHLSGYYAWQLQPLSAPSGRPTPWPDQAMLARKRASYGYRKIRDDLEMGETQETPGGAINASARVYVHKTGYRRRPGHYGWPAGSG